MQRIIGRQICSKCGQIFNQFYKPSLKENHICGNEFLERRSDDNEETVLNRYETYTKLTLPILDFYRKQKILHEIDGLSKIDQINKEIQRIIETLET